MISTYFRRTIFALAMGAIVLIGQGSLAQTATTKQHAPSENAYKQLTPEERIEKRLDRMSKKLELTEQQKAEIRAILKEDLADLQAARAAMKNAETPEAKKEARFEFRAQAKTTQERIASVLTTEQRAQVKEFRQERREKVRELRREHREERKQLREELREGRGKNKK